MTVESTNYLVLAGFREFWKVTEIKNAIFHDLESFGRERIFKIAMKKFWLLFVKWFFVSYQAPHMFRLLALLFIIQGIIHRKIMKYIVKKGIFLLLWGFKIQMETSFMVLVFGYLAFEKVKVVLDILKEFVLILNCSIASLWRCRVIQ